MSQDNEIWNWHSDTQGRVHSVSSGFTSNFGTSAAKDIIGSYFWTFAERLEHPSNGWVELENAFRRHEKISKFIFHYQTQSQEKIKIAISGEPVFDKNKYIGFAGIGYIADSNEISIPELSQNMLALSVDNLNLGMAIFSPDIGLIEFNQHFIDHLYSAKIKVIRNMPYDSLMLSLEMQNTLLTEISAAKDNLNNHNTYYFEKSDDIILSIEKISLENGFIILKSEIDKSLLNNINNYTNHISELKQKNRMLENRIEDYKNKLSGFFSKDDKNDKNDVYFKKILSFFENNLDIGVFITDNDGTVDTVNYMMAQIFGFTTVSMLTNNIDKDTDFQKYLIERTQNITDLMDNNLNRFEHIMSINNYVYQGNVREVILFYPSVYNPQKIISLFYPETQNTVMTAQEDIKNTDTKNNNIFNAHQNFIEYIVSDIKNSVNVINGYNQLEEMARNINKSSKISQEQIYQSCNNILRSISDVMRVSKISSDMLNLNQSIFSCYEIIQECLDNFEDYIMQNNLSVKLDVKTHRLLMVTDRDIFYSAMYKMIDILLHASETGAKLRIKIIENPYADKMEIILMDEAKINIEYILNTDVNDIFKMPNTRYTGSLNFKIAENYFKLLECTIHATYQEDRGNTITIKIADDIITTDDARNSDNLVI